MKKSLLLLGVMSFLLIGCSAKKNLSVKFTDKKKSDGHRKVLSLVLDSLTGLVSWLAVLVLAIAILLLVKKGR